jgi:hypothetical protein
MKEPRNNISSLKTQWQTSDSERPIGMYLLKVKSNILHFRSFTSHLLPLPSSSSVSRSSLIHRDALCSADTLQQAERLIAFGWPCLWW